MRILVTGANGFVGQRLCKNLKEGGHEVLQFDVEQGDITEIPEPNGHLDHIFHLAARTFVPESWKNPYEFYKTNTLGTEAILEICRIKNCSLTYISSYVYGLPEQLPINELHPVKPNTPYNHSKLLGEELCRFYNQHFKVNVTVLRPFNIYGYGQSQHFLIPTILGQILNPALQEVTIQNLTPKRDYLYIDDFINCIMSTLGLNGFKIYNVGSGKSYSVGEIIQIIQDITGLNKMIIETGERRNNEINDVVADISLIKSEISWEPKLKFREGLELIVRSLMEGKH
ncbi:NAD-dependent epimerase/dehydratase family protein [Saccharicrinis sp. FJH54]|uniref:NAD-dependent epimerase/dehydratase family protein n=1 Tax=Saccharicrinis sp. FJH54 TaxID=3344665 RepID=UPI0035D42DC4